MGVAFVSDWSIIKPETSHLLTFLETDTFPPGPDVTADSDIWTSASVFVTYLDITKECDTGIRDTAHKS